MQQFLVGDTTGVWLVGQIQMGGGVSLAVLVASDPRWALLEEARSELLAAFAADGVVDIRYVAAFPELVHPAVWLCTTTDIERDTLGRENPRLDDVRRILREVGFSEDDLSRLVTVAQSQETVDKAFEGSWFYAMR